MEGASCFDVEMVGISESNETQIVLLHEVRGLHTVPIKIGIFEASCIDRQLTGNQLVRPLTHDVIHDAIVTLGGTIESAVIHKFADDIYYSELRIRQQAVLRTVDLRPSDAIMVAILADCPIFITDAVLKDSNNPTH